MFLVKYVRRVISEILNAEANGKPRFQDYGHQQACQLAQHLPGLFVADGSSPGSQEGPFFPPALGPTAIKQGTMGFSHFKDFMEW